MNVTVEDQSPTRKILVVEVDAKTVAAEEKALLLEFQKHAKLPGFRPGKAPEAIVRQRYKKEMRADLNQRVLQKAFEDGAKESKLEIFSVVDQEVDDFAEKGEGTARLTVDIRPDFDLPDYEGIQVPEAPAEVSDEEVEETIQSMRQQRADYQVVEREAQAGDYVKCSYSGEIDGKPVDEVIEGLPPMYGKQSTTWEEAGSEEAPGVQAIIQGLLGMNVGDEKEVEETFAADFSVEALQGKTVAYKLSVEEVREKVLPEMDADFFKSMEVENQEQLRERVQQSVAQQKAQNNSQQQRQAIQEHLLKQVDFPIPESAVESERSNILRDYMQRAMQQGASQEDFESRKEELMQGAGKAASDRVKLQMILAQIAEKEAIKAENEDMSRMIMQQAMMERRKPDELVKELQKDRSRIDAMRQEIVFGKTLDRLLEKADKQPVPAEGSPA